MNKFNYTIDGNRYEVVINSVENNVASVELNGKPMQVTIEKEESCAAPVAINRSGSSAAPAAPGAAAKGGKNSVKSPLPGTVVSIKVAVGQAVKKNDVLVSIEAMKMENNILAEQDGVVKEILVSQGQNIMQGDVIINMECAGSPAPAPKAAPKAAAPKAAAPAPKAAAPAAGAGTISSPLPGTIVSIKVAAGQSVKKNDVLLSIEAMKMENNILADRDGVVKSILVSQGQNVMQGDALITLN